MSRYDEENSKINWVQAEPQNPLPVTQMQDMVNYTIRLPQHVPRVCAYVFRTL